MKIKLENGIGFTIEKRVVELLDPLIEFVVTQDEDCLILFDGKEGAGKSLLKAQVGSYIAYVLRTKYNIKEAKYDVDNIHFDLQEYINTARDNFNAGVRHHINDLDEGRKVANRKKGGTKDVLKFTDFLSECRGYNQFHLIALPSYHDFADYVVKWRMAFLINIIKTIEKDASTNSGLTIVRGHYRVFKKNANLIKYYDDWHLKYRYPPPYTNSIKGNVNNSFQGTFKKYPVSVIDEQAYKKKKLYNMELKYGTKKDKEKEEEKTLFSFSDQRIEPSIFSRLYSYFKAKRSLESLATILNTSCRTLRNYRSKIENNSLKDLWEEENKGSDNSNDKKDIKDSGIISNTRLER